MPRIKTESTIQFATIAKYLSLVLLLAGAVLAIPIEQKTAGYLSLFAGVVATLVCDKNFRRHIILLYISVCILALTPIGTDVALSHSAPMAALLVAALLVPYLVTRFVYRERVIRYSFGKHSWTRAHFLYLLLAFALSYVLLPLWMQTTNGHLHWTVATDPGSLLALFIGTNGLGIWDELFFIVTALALLRKHFSFGQANLAQAVLFTSFLYELGFRGWAPIAIFAFALLQGLVFRKTENLAYIIAIHLTIDFVLYLALINAHYPELLNIFV